MSEFGPVYDSARHSEYQLCHEAITARLRAERFDVVVEDFAGEDDARVMGRIAAMVVGQNEHINPEEIFGLIGIPTQKIDEDSYPLDCTVNIDVPVEEGEYDELLDAESQAVVIGAH